MPSVFVTFARFATFTTSRMPSNRAESGDAIGNMQGQSYDRKSRAVRGLRAVFNGIAQRHLQVRCLAGQK